MYLEKFKLGRAGQELEFDRHPSSIETEAGEISKDERNKQGDLRKSFFKFAPIIKISIENLTVEEADRINDIVNDINGQHKFLVYDSFRIYREYRNASTAAEVILQNASRTGITVVGIWLSTDFGKSGQNYYLGGNFVENTLTATLGTALPGPHTEVIVEYTYQGWNIKIDNISSRIKNKLGRIDLTLNMRGR